MGVNVSVKNKMVKSYHVFLPKLHLTTGGLVRLTGSIFFLLIDQKGSQLLFLSSSSFVWVYVLQGHKTELLKVLSINADRWLIILWELLLWITGTVLCICLFFTATCEMCGMVGVRDAFYSKTKRFCSVSCSRSYSSNSKKASILARLQVNIVTFSVCLMLMFNYIKACFFSIRANLPQKKLKSYRNNLSWQNWQLTLSTKQISWTRPSRKLVSHQKADVIFFGLPRSDWIYLCTFCWFC